MKNGFFAGLFLAFILWLSLGPSVKTVGAQAFGIAPIATTIGGCPPSGSGQALLCAVGSGSSFQWYQSFSGSTYVPLVSQQAPLQGNISNCATASISASTGLVTTKCTIQ